MSAFWPSEVDELPNMRIIDVGCGDTFSCFVTDYGEVYMAGKGIFEKQTENDIETFSSPFPVLLELEIWQVFCGANHIFCLDFYGKCFSLGVGNDGCLGLGDNKNWLKFCPVTSLHNHKVIDISIGLNFTVFLIAKDFIRKQESFSVQEGDKLSQFVAKFKNTNIRSVRAQEKDSIYAKNRVVMRIKGWKETKNFD
jgi:alpha-tubulin suppressor-like RCC1 family protein